MESIGVPALAHQPTRRFWAEPEKTELEDGRDTLEGGWDPPSPRGIDLERAKSTPCSNNGTGVPEGVVKGSQRSAVGGISQFGNQHGSTTRRKGETEPDEETSANEHPDILGDGLKDSGDNLSQLSNGK